MQAGHENVRYRHNNLERKCFSQQDMEMHCKKNHFELSERKLLKQENRKKTWWKEHQIIRLQTSCSQGVSTQSDMNEGDYYYYQLVYRVRYDWRRLIITSLHIYSDMTEGDCYYYQFVHVVRWIKMTTYSWIHVVLIWVSSLSQLLISNASQCVCSFKSFYPEKYRRNYKDKDNRKYINRDRGEHPLYCSKIKLVAFPWTLRVEIITKNKHKQISI